MMGVVAQGLMQFLSVRYTNEVWRSFGSWLRTIRQGIAPSELVVSIALRNTLREFLIVGSENHELAIFVSARQAVDLHGNMAAAA